MNSLGLKIIQHLKKNPWQESSFELFEYGNFPVECPWQKYQEQDTKEFIRAIFQPLENLIPSTFERLLVNCQSIYALLENDQWFLIYAINEDTFLCGGESTNIPVLTIHAISDGWELPAELKTFYSVHNGFGALWSLGMFWGSHCVVPDNKLETLNSLLNSLREHEPDINFTFDPKLLLQFFPNGLGDAQCFYRLENGELTTVDWDHESREIYRPENFWNFVDKRLSELI